MARRNTFASSTSRHFDALPDLVAIVPHIDPAARMNLD
jgi:hypothetical protein